MDFAWLGCVDLRVDCLKVLSHEVFHRQRLGRVRLVARDQPELKQVVKVSYFHAAVSHLQQVYERLKVTLALVQ